MEIHDHLRLEAKRHIKEVEEGNKKYFSTQWTEYMINGEYLKKTETKKIHMLRIGKNQFHIFEYMIMK